MKKTYWIYGTHAVKAALENPHRLCHRLCVLKNAEMPPHAKELRAETVEVGFFKKMFGDQAVHQGVALEVEFLPSLTIHDLLHDLSSAETALIAVLDQITDPQK